MTEVNVQTKLFEVRELIEDAQFDMTFTPEQQMFLNTLWTKVQQTIDEVTAI
jgi:hypothetical protein